jgi:hypothetical protein
MEGKGTGRDRWKSGVSTKNYSIPAASDHHLGIFGVNCMSKVDNFMNMVDKLYEMVDKN